MSDPYLYDSGTINGKVSKGKIGNYALGYTNEQGSFIPKYVGRSDTDLQAELMAHLEDKNHHKKFMFSYASSTTNAFKEECRNYHDFKKQLENEKHPDSPNGMNLTCPFSHNNL